MIRTCSFYLRPSHDTRGASDLLGTGDSLTVSDANLTLMGSSSATISGRRDGITLASGANISGVAPVQDGSLNALGIVARLRGQAALARDSWKGP